MGILTPVDSVIEYETVNELNEDEDSDVDFPETIIPEKNDKNFEIPATVLNDKEALKRHLKMLKRQARDERRREFKIENDEGLPPHVQDLYDRAVKDVPKSEHSKVKKLIIKYANTFAKTSTDMGQTTWIKHDIETGDHSPVRQRPRRLRIEQRDEVQKQIKALQQQGLIRPSTSEWASNVVLVKKKEGTWRMCIDYRELNKKTLNPDTYMLPRIDDTIDALSRAKYFCTLDILQGYHNVELTERAKEKTAFHAPFCNPSHWEYVYMPFGLVRAPRTF